MVIFIAIEVIRFTNNRLKRLENNGLVRRELYQERPKRYAYHLTEKGQDLAPVMQSMMVWSNKHIPDTYKVEDILKGLKADYDLGSE